MEATFPSEELMPKTVAVYPGSFDPITLGHVDIIKRGCRMFDLVIAAVVDNPSKKSLFTVKERLDMLRHSFDGYSNLKFDSFNGLLVEYAENKNANVVVRGIRAITDFEYEMQMALMNKRLSDHFETVFLMPKEEYIYVSSRLVKEIAELNGDVSKLVSPYVQDKLNAKFVVGG